MDAQGRRPRVVIIGAGFGGLWAARTLANQPVDVLIVDQNNYHTFLALLYQVAAAELEAEDIAYPVRSILWNFPNVDFLLARVHFIDWANHVVMTNCRDIPYDFLILGNGSISHTFGITGVAEHAFFLKTLDEGVALKNHIICTFENASREPDEVRRRRLLTFVIVGGGATGVEYAGALSELIHGPLRKDYRTIDFSEVRVILLEAAPSLVGNLPQRICEYTTQRLTRMGADVRLQTRVLRVEEEAVFLGNGQTIPTSTVVWTAGIQGEPVAAASGLPSGRDGRVPVLPTLQVPGHPDVFAVGDLAFIQETPGKGLPQVAQVAIQSGVAAARNILNLITAKPLVPFRYHDRGSMITIGRNAAGAVIGSHIFTGFTAWIIWLVIHLFNLIGFRNRVLVLTNWAWDYILYERAMRFVFPSDLCSGAQSPFRPPPAGESPPGEEK